MVLPVPYPLVPRRKEVFSQTERKKVGWSGSSPRAAASAALPWATVGPPLSGLWQEWRRRLCDGRGALKEGGSGNEWRRSIKRAGRGQAKAECGQSFFLTTLS